MNNLKEESFISTNIDNANSRIDESIREFAQAWSVIFATATCTMLGLETSSFTALFGKARLLKKHKSYIKITKKTYTNRIKQLELEQEERDKSTQWMLEKAM